MHSQSIAHPTQTTRTRAVRHAVLPTLHRGGGAKRRLRLVDFSRRKEGVEGVVERLEYDPNRTGYIALVTYPSGAPGCMSIVSYEAFDWLCIHQRESGM